MERQQALRLQRRRRQPSEAGVDDDGSPPSSRPRGGSSGLLTRAEVVQMLHKSSPPSLRRLQQVSPRWRQHEQQQGQQEAAAKAGRNPSSCSSSPSPSIALTLQSAGPFRGLATLPVLLGVPPACVNMEARIASLTPAQVQAILKPRNYSLLRLLCPEESQAARPLCVQPSPSKSEVEASGSMTPLSPTVEAALSSLMFGADGEWGVGEEDLSGVGEHLWDSPTLTVGVYNRREDGAK